MKDSPPCEFWAAKAGMPSGYTRRRYPSWSSAPVGQRYLPAVPVRGTDGRSRCDSVDEGREGLEA